MGVTDLVRLGLDTVLFEQLLNSNPQLREREGFCDEFVTTCPSALFFYICDEPW